MLGRWKPGERAYIDAGTKRQPRGLFWTIRTAVKSRSHSLSGGLVALALLTVPNADKVDCGNVADRYKAAVAQIVNALRSYATCVSSSDKRDDCVAEMQALDNAHDDFADAVADSKMCR